MSGMKGKWTQLTKAYHIASYIDLPIHHSLSFVRFLRVGYPLFKSNPGRQFLS
ncbi:hypothetical protein AAG906_031691 [Vitis piasezkii]|uniref:Uncharacterized protein n=1 Tax=Vitis vinifera TaxID=29760 RepID=D7T8Y1_VITVI